MITEKEQAEMLRNLDNACPWDTTFLFLEPGCESVGQGTELANAIKQAMQASFNRWADSWIRPYLVKKRGDPCEPA